MVECRFPYSTSFREDLSGAVVRSGETLRRNSHGGLGQVGSPTPVVGDGIATRSTRVTTSDENRQEQTHGRLGVRG